MSHITLNTTIHEIFHHPEIGDLNQYLIYCLDKDLWLNEHVNAIMDQPPSLTLYKAKNSHDPSIYQEYGCFYFCIDMYYF